MKLFFGDYGLDDIVGDYLREDFVNLFGRDFRKWENPDGFHPVLI